jgi:hypothetical protein
MSVWPSAIGRMQTEDTNHDGRPDIWRYYDARGELTHISIDTNFDGHPDREEQYSRGSLWRRETDRNFDERVDLVEEFDPATHEHLRSTVDVDFDGRADLRVLFADGRPVHSEWAKPVAEAARRDASVASSPADGLMALFDPFSQTAAFGIARSTRAADMIAIAVDGLVIDRADLFCDAPLCRDQSPLAGGVRSRFAFSPASPRAPPFQTL